MRTSWKNARERFAPCTIDLRQLCNLIVDLASVAQPPPLREGVTIDVAARADDRALSWIDATFGGWWSSEANAGSNAIARRDGELLGFATIDAQELKFSWLRGLARDPGVGVFGPFGVAVEQRGSGLGTALLRRSLLALRKRGYRRALIAAVGDERLARYYAGAVNAAVAERFDVESLFRRNRRTIVLASGSGTNLQSVLDAVAGGTLPLEIVGVVSNNPRAVAIERARRAGVRRIEVIAWNKAGEGRGAYDARLLETVRSFEPDLVLLLGWMHLLAPEFVERFPETLNIHPAFLPLDPRCDRVTLPDGSVIPAFRGPRAVRDALAAPSSWVGATFHRITSHTDRGPVMARKPLSVGVGEEEEELMQRLHALEHEVVRAGITRWLYEPAR
ncbi:MAG: GNAT family N-acetyltransferase [Candidatus Eremiobacteraeota bacterium]|nr:GNAT family N-acetyltransferase [Candidatus Eremiobacteraeota bacterium]